MLAPAHTSRSNTDLPHPSLATVRQYLHPAVVRAVRIQRQKKARPPLYVMAITHPSPLRTRVTRSAAACGVNKSTCKTDALLRPSRPRHERVRCGGNSAARSALCPGVPITLVSAARGASADKRAITSHKNCCARLCSAQALSSAAILCRNSWTCSKVFKGAWPAAMMLLPGDRTWLPRTLPRGQDLFILCHIC